MQKKAMGITLMVGLQILSCIVQKQKPLGFMIIQKLT